MKKILLRAAGEEQSFVVVQPESIEDKEHREENEQQAEDLARNREDEEKIIKVAPGVENVAHIKHGVVKKEKDGWHVRSENGKNLGGPYDTKEEAVSRLRQVEYYKHHKGRRIVTADMFIYDEYSRHHPANVYENPTQEQIDEYEREYEEKYGRLVVKALPYITPTVEREKVKKQKQNSPAIQEHEDYFLGEEHENYPRIVGRDIMGDNPSYQKSWEDEAKSLPESEEYDKKDNDLSKEFWDKWNPYLDFLRGLALGWTQENDQYFVADSLSRGGGLVSPGFPSLGKMFEWVEKNKNRLELRYQKRLKKE